MKFGGVDRETVPIILGLASLATVTVFGLSIGGNQAHWSADYCSSPDCTRATWHIREHMGQGVTPCPPTRDIVFRSDVFGASHRIGYLRPGSCQIPTPAASHPE
jgi:hypothetical protein